MNTLIVDEQTINDLGIFGKNQQPGIFDLYNGVQTRGGEVLLKHYFKSPLADAYEINRRSRIMEHFAVQNLTFPFEASLLDLVEKYLAPVSGQDRHQHALSEKEIQQGVRGLILLIQALHAFLWRSDIEQLGPYQPERLPLVHLLNDIALDPVLKEKNPDKLSFSAVTAYDTLFRMQERGKVQQFLQHLYTLDIYMAMAQLASDRHFTFPKALEQGIGTLRLEKVYHPELDRPIENDVSMDNQGNVIFLTGANMAGKSTFLRAISTAVYIAHIGFPVAARSMEFSVLDGMYTTINLPDNLGIGASHFYNEVLRVKKVAQELHQGKSLYVVFDELFRGTNVKDAEEGTVALTSAFAGKKNSLFLISSHIVEAGESLKEMAGIRFQFLPTQMQGNIPVYTYKLREGITDDRHGMVIIRNEGILKILENGLNQLGYK